jgi:hypothetical protein
MRRGLSLAILLPFCMACGKPTVADRIDAIRESGVRFAHAELPSPQRMAELYPGYESGGIKHGIGHELRANEHAAAILDAGQAAVPELVRLLDDPRRATLAAVFLAEIGGRESAMGLLARWRALRGVAKEMSVYRVRDGKTYAEGYRDEGVDGEFYTELIAALCYVGRAVGAEVAANTKAAMDEAERLQHAGERLLYEERRDEPAGEVELRWRAEPIQTAQEGLKMLAMAGAAEGVDLLVRALRSPVKGIRWEALAYVAYLGHGKDRTLPVLGGLLDDPEWRDKALDAVATILDRGLVPPSPGEEETAAKRYKKRLQELGHLPR